MKTVTDDMSKKQIYLMYFSSTAALYFLAFCLLFPLFWYILGSAILGFIAGIALPASHIKVKVEKLIISANKALDDTHNLTIKSQKKLDYYYYNLSGSIAVSAVDGKISHVRVLPNKNILPPVIFDRSEIQNFFYFDPGVTTTNYYGRNLATAQRIHTQNLSAQISRAQEKGLHIEVNNIDTPKIFINMTAKEADHWCLIIKNLINQTLEPVAIPRHIP